MSSSFQDKHQIKACDVYITFNPVDEPWVSKIKTALQEENPKIKILAEVKEVNKDEVWQDAIFKVMVTSKRFVLKVKVTGKRLVLTVTVTIKTQGVFVYGKICLYMAQYLCPVRMSSRSEMLG
jgi:hypothetical protein